MQNEESIVVSQQSATQEEFAFQNISTEQAERGKSNGSLGMLDFVKFRQ